MYRNGNETPSLQADSADSKCFSLFGTRSLNVDFDSTEAANTGSVGDRQAPMMRAAGTLVRNIRYANSEVMAQENVMIGPKNHRTDFQCRLK